MRLVTTRAAKNIHNARSAPKLLMVGIKGGTGNQEIRKSGNWKYGNEEIGNEENIAFAWPNDLATVVRNSLELTALIDIDRL